jgi:hypothetical protein
MIRDIIQIACMFFFIWFLASCTRGKNEDRYTQLVNKELASGRRNDSIFFGIYLAMPAKKFFTHCWELNKKGIFKDGLGNTAVLYKFNNNELKFPASMYFYPEMEQNKIKKMLVSFQYDGWAPWNKHMFADSLLTDVLQLYKRWYIGGNSFIQLRSPEKNSIYVKVDGNRRITVSKKNDMEVEVSYTDLLK